MAMPLAVLAVLSIFIFYTPNPVSAEQGWFLTKWINSPELHTPNSTRFNFMQSAEMIAQTSASEHSAVLYSEQYSEAMHSAHYPAMFLSLFLLCIRNLFSICFLSMEKG